MFTYYIMYCYKTLKNGIKKLRFWGIKMLLLRRDVMVGLNI